MVKKAYCLDDCHVKSSNPRSPVQIQISKGGNVGLCSNSLYQLFNEVKVKSLSKQKMCLQDMCISIAVSIIHQYIDIHMMGIGHNDITSVVVCDNGSSTCKAGFAGEDLPSVIIQTQVGRPNHNGAHIDSSRSTFVGDIAARNKTNLKFTQPIKNGVIVDWDDMEDVWNHLFLQNLRIDPEVHKVLMTEPPHNDNFKREKMTQILFEYFNIPALQIANTAVLSLIATGYR